MQNSSDFGNILELHAKIYGRVQGVGYRFNTEIEALKYRINGTVKNLPDGGVEVVAQAKKEQLEHFLEVLKKGPGYVESVKTEYRQPTNLLEGFKIIF